MSTPTPEEEKEEPKSPSRRKTLEIIGKTSFFAGFAGIITSTMRYLLPNVLYEPPTTFVVGVPNDFPPDSVNFIQQDRLFIFRRPEGMYVISAICTHLGCNVRWNAVRRGFDCPCHGSKYDKNGKNISGPAPKPLKWYALTLNSDGQLVVNTRRLVNDNYRLQV